ncbi:MAG TPA: T9SS type A sorting domain-containing protein [Bacteroidia bacterium]|jgi:hypothetical protein|nr:T9SS type A sorting domain-containing protein [Bacteroidia bacterium]
MKKLIILCILILFVKSVNAQWQVIGQRQFTSGAASPATMNTSSLDLVINSKGTPYVSFQDGSLARKASVMKFDGSNWVFVGSAGFSTGAANNLHLAIDKHDSLYVVYSDGTDSSVYVKKFNSVNQWQQVGSTNLKAVFVNIAASKAGVPFITYVNGNNAYAEKFNGNNWISLGQVNISGNIPDGDLEIEVDTNNIPYVGYHFHALPNPGSEAWKYSGSNWVNAGGVYYANLTKMKVNNSGVAYLGYYDQPHGVCGIVNYTTSYTTCFADMDLDSASHPFIAENGYGNPSIHVWALGLNNNPSTPPFITYGDLRIAIDKSNTPAYGTIYLAFNDTGTTGKLTVIANTNAFGIKDISAEQNTLAVYPNPSSESIIIKSTEELGSIIVLNSIGQIVLQNHSKKIYEQLDISKLPSGIYILQVAGKCSRIVKD